MNQTLQYILVGVFGLLVYYLIVKQPVDNIDEHIDKVAKNVMMENQQLKTKLGILEDKAGEYSTVIDYRRLNDALSIPYRRLPSLVPDSQNVIPINVNTQGIAEPVQALGYITNSTDDQILQLFGRKLYDDNYEYYTRTADDAPIKIPIDTNNNQELYDGDTVSITPYNTKTWTTHLYELDYPRYIPVV
jgi:hypothetical protein